VANKEIAVKKYVVRLSSEERAQLEAMVRAGKSSAQLLRRARIPLKADVSEAAMDGATAQSQRRWTPASTMSLAPVSSWSKRDSRRR
jgi:hypothetical protein